jgi:hypothetical protein
VENSATITKFINKVDLNCQEHLMANPQKFFYLNRFSEIHMETFWLFDQWGNYAKVNPAEVNPKFLVSLQKNDSLQKRNEMQFRLYINRIDSAHRIRLLQLHLDSILNNSMLFEVPGCMKDNATEPVDYTLVIFWKVYFGKKSLLKFIKPCLKAIEENQHVRFKVYLLNMDYRSDIPNAHRIVTSFKYKIKRRQVYIHIEDQLDDKLPL